ncbi:MAG: hypothetical protein MUP33_11760 [Polaromonas sp.]|nr:hypothetical protein [Polaromonas sp.]
MYKNLVTTVISTRVVACFSFSALALSPAAVPVKRSDAKILSLNPYAHTYPAGTP